MQGYKSDHSTTEILLKMAAVLTLVVLWIPSAHAVPSYSRQTGLACNSCHYTPPELTPFGRKFKLEGYTFATKPEINNDEGSDKGKPKKDHNSALNLLEAFPLSVVFDTSFSATKSPQPGTQNGTFEFPQAVSLFLAGAWGSHVGSFVQVTYDPQADHFSWDNTDIRYANNSGKLFGKQLTYGITMNNNPTVEDLWNSTPAWGFPYAGSNAVVSPLAGTQIDGALAQDVAGISAYVMWNESLYGELGAYRSAKQGVLNPITGAAGPLDGTVSNVISGAAPYGRVAYEHQLGRHDLEIGVYGATFKLLPGGGSVGAPASLSGPVNEFKDIAEDLQYQFVGDEHLFSLAATHIHEAMRLDASFAAGATTNPSDNLTTTRLIGTYYFRRKYGGSISHFSTTGSVDPGLYPAGPAPGVITSANGSPDTRGWIAELNYLPWLNTKLSLQYTTYTQFNGGNSNYDGFGRNASANGSTYLLLWLTF